MLIPDENRPAFEPEDNGVRKEGEVSLPPVIENESEPEEEKEEIPFKVFKTEDEYKSFIDEQKKAVAIPDKKEEEKEEDLILYKGHVDPESGEWVGEKPADWNDFAKTLITNPVTRKVLAKLMSKEVVAEIRNMSASEKAEQDKISKEFDEEYNALAKKSLVPELSTPEGKVINQQISLIGATYRIPSITKAYDLWAKLPKEHGGGLGYSPQKATQQLRREKAALVGGGRKVSGATTEKPRNYEDIHKRSLDELVQERAKE